MSEEVASAEHNDNAAVRVERLIDAVGAFGRFQKLLMLLLQFEAIEISLRVLVVPFALLQPDLVCNGGNGSNFTDNCEILSNCVNLSYVPKYGFHSLFLDWPDLILRACTSVNPVLVMLTVKEIVSGIMFFPLGMIPDAFGRRRTTLAAVAIRSIATFAAAASTSFRMFSVFYVLCSIGNAVTWVSTGSLSNEVTLSKYRLAMSFSFTWAFTYGAAALAAFWIRSWYGMLYAAATCGVLLFLAFLLVLPESPRWLIARGKYGKAASSLNHIARLNGVKVRYTECMLRNEIQPFQEKDQEKKNKVARVAGDLKHLVTAIQDRTVLKFFAFLVVYCVFVNAIITNFIVNAGELNFNTYASIALVSAYRCWTPFFVIGMDIYYPRFSRRFFLLLSMVASTAPLIVAVPLAIAIEETSDPTSWMSIVLAQCALISAAMTNGLLGYAVVQVCKEVIPTVSRSAFMAVVAVLFCIGEALGPQVILLSDVWPPLHYVVAAVTMVVAMAMAYYCVPETKSTPLPDSYVEMEAVLHTDDAKDHTK